ncbi:hypothetical protein BJF95_18415 [Rhizobium oryziradicis]|uniref:Uncharacterized protein n=1 Tax=Rhizobium oryziradicis TaxID=1867956 RepID=A0A1Q8ZT85_9HYPH|nr:hypothetical protein BJF95_18415 [Rhizobium oryziradicis]
MTSPFGMTLCNSIARDSGAAQPAIAFCLHVMGAMVDAKNILVLAFRLVSIFLSVNEISYFSMKFNGLCKC